MTVTPAIRIVNFGGAHIGGALWFAADRDESEIRADIDASIGAETAFTIVASRGFCDYLVENDTPIGRLSVVARGIRDRGTVFAAFAQLDELDSSELDEGLPYVLSVFDNASRGAWESLGAYAEARLSVDFDGLHRIRHLIDFDRYAEEIDCVYVTVPGGVHVFSVSDLTPKHDYCEPAGVTL